MAKLLDFLMYMLHVYVTRWNSTPSWQHPVVDSFAETAQPLDCGLVFIFQEMAVGILTTLLLWLFPCTADKEGVIS